MDKIASDQLPEPMQAMTLDEQTQFIAKKKAERDSLRRQILQLSDEREAYVAEEQEKSQAAAAPTFNDAITAAISEQAQKKHFEFEK